MGTCEVCGQQGDLEKTRVEGTVLKVCEDCRELGESAEQEVERDRKRSRSSRDAPEKELVPGFGGKVKEAREGNGWSVKELAERLKEKESVVRRVESGRLKPDRGLARKFERELSVSLYEKPPEESGTGDVETGGGQTLGDVADVKKD